MQGKKSYRILLHPGFAKAMTTFFQDVLFSRHNQINNIGKQYWDAKLSKRICFATADLIRDITGKDTIDYNPMRIEASFVRIVEERFRSNQVNTISDESLTYACNADRQKIASRLNALMPGAKVLFTIRSQFTLLISAYFWLRFTKLCIPDTFSDWLRASQCIYNDIYDDFFLRQYRYYEVIDAYKNLFGRKNIMVLPIESFAGEKRVACERIADFVGISADETQSLLVEQPKNVRHSSAAIAYFRFYNKLRWIVRKHPGARDLLPPPKGANKRIVDLLDRVFPAGRIDLDAQSRQFIANYYKSGNLKLSREYDLPLETYGYPMEVDQ